MRNRIVCPALVVALLLSSSGCSPTPVQAGNYIWTQRSQGMWGASIRALAISPNYPTDSTIFAGTWDGGVFKWTNGSSSWEAMNAGLTNLNIEALALTPTAPLTLFAGTYGSGVWQYTMTELPYKTYFPVIRKNR